MKIKFYKKHLDMMITKSDGLADGLMGRYKLCYLCFYTGQFMGKAIQIDTEYNIMKIGDHRLISVVIGTAWSFLGTDEDCWYGKSTNNQGGEVIEGNYMDYVVDVLLSSP